MWRPFCICLQIFSPCLLHSHPGIAQLMVWLAIWGVYIHCLMLLKCLQGPLNSSFNYHLLCHDMVEEKEREEVFVVENQVIEDIGVLKKILLDNWGEYSTIYLGDIWSIMLYGLMRSTFRAQWSHCDCILLALLKLPGHSPDFSGPFYVYHLRISMYYIQNLTPLL